MQATSGIGWARKNSQVKSQHQHGMLTEILVFSFVYPTNWTEEIAKEGYLLLKGPADERVPNIIVQVMRSASLGGNYSSYEDAASDVLAKLNTYDNYSLHTNNRIQSREIVCSYSYGGVALKQSRIFF